MSTRETEVLYTLTELCSMKRYHMKFSSLKASIYSLLMGAVFIIVSGAGHTGAQASSINGDFAVRGIGSFTCNELSQSLISNEGTRVAYAEWVSGYLTALNRKESNTFDVSYVVNSLNITTLVDRICLTQPTIMVEKALSNLTDALRLNKVEKKTELIRLSLGEESITLRQSILDQFITKLVEEGYLNTFRSFDDTAKDAVIVYQQKNNLPVSGLPDFNTLIWSLLAVN